MIPNCLSLLTSVSNGGFDFNAVFQEGVGDRTIYREIDAWKVPLKLKLVEYI